MFLGQTPPPSEGSPIPYDDDRTETLPGSESPEDTDIRKPEVLTKSSSPTDNRILYLLGAAAIYFYFLRKK